MGSYSVNFFLIIRFKSIKSYVPYLNVCGIVMFPSFYTESDKL